MFRNISKYFNLSRKSIQVKDIQSPPVIIDKNQKFIDEILERIKYIPDSSIEHKQYLSHHKKEFAACCSTVPLPSGVIYDYTRINSVYEKHGLDKDFCQRQLYNFWGIDLTKL